MSTCKKLSISIVNFQSKEYLQKGLTSVFKNINEADFEVIVANNDESENLEEIQKKFPRIKIINHKKNIGFGAGHNLGVREAKGEIILFLNPDVELKESIEPIMEFFEKNKTVGVVGPRLIESNGEVQKWSAGKKMSLLNLIGNNIGFSSSKKIWESKKIRKADWVSGAALFIKKDLFNKIGGFDDNFFMYFEDDDLCRRVWEVGQKVVYFPKITVKHWGGKSFEEEKKQKKYFYASQEYYFKKHLGRWQTGALKVLRRIIIGA